MLLRELESLLWTIILLINFCGWCKIIKVKHANQIGMRWKSYCLLYIVSSFSLKFFINFLFFESVWDTLRWVLHVRCFLSVSWTFSAMMKSCIFIILLLFIQWNTLGSLIHYQDESLDFEDSSDESTYADYDFVDYYTPSHS